MAHQLHLEKKNYRQWVKAGLGLIYLKEGLVPFCEDLAKRQHKDFLDKIKQTKNISTVTCGQCPLDTLKPDHEVAKQGKNKYCKLGQQSCNCKNPSGKCPCPNNVCGAIYDVIVRNHGSLPPKPNWKNTDTQQWCTDPWSIAKCFINAPGYEQKTSATEIDCTGLLHLIINNLGYHEYIQCDFNGSDVFSQVIQYRNNIFHSSFMELEEETADNYIQDMIAVLPDGKELGKRLDAQDAVQKLQELMKEDFIVTTRNEADVVRAAVESINDTIREFENKLREKLENVPTRDDIAGLDTRVTDLESRVDTVEEEMDKLKAVQSSQEEQYHYVKSKLEFQKSLIKLYRESLLQVSAVPLQPERNHCNFSEVYVRPRMTYITKNKNRRKQETKIKSMSDIFSKDGITQKSIYVLGDAGAGKSSFCKSLVDYWCLAHCEGPEVNSVKDEFSGVTEMQKFDFLFYISLRHCKDVTSIQEMLEKQYKSEVLSKLLDKGSEKIIIVLDGLDEWSPPNPLASCQFQTKGIPERDIYKDYTMITTTRPWKIETLRLTDREREQRLTLKGFDESSVKKVIYKLVPILNESFEKSKSPCKCDQELKTKSLASLKQVPIMLIQLICLWFDDKLAKTSRCAIYTGMLELFFSWNDNKNEELKLFENMRKMSEDSPNVELPQYLIDNNMCKTYKYLVHAMAHLAYETLFKNTKETYLTFDRYLLEQLKISNEIRTSCLRLGILSENKCPSLSASTCQSTVLSFVHKSVQEYLAAVYIAAMYRARFGSSANADLSHQCTQFIETYFSHCATLDAVLEQENVLVMLCGLEPRISTSVSKYIYNIVTRDERVLEYRRTVHDNYRHISLISNIQQCILNSIEEVQASQTGSQFNFYLGDIVGPGQLPCDNKQYISHDSVLSCRIEHFDMTNEYLSGIIEYMLKCHKLENNYVKLFKNNETDVNCIGRAIDGNVSTLKALSVDSVLSNDILPIFSTIIRRLPDMKQLVALKLKYYTMTHDDFTSLCAFLSGTSHLEQISINIRCACRNQHEVDLSKLLQLQYLEYGGSVIVTCANASKLEIFGHLSLDSTNYVKVVDVLNTANELKTLDLDFSGISILFQNTSFSIYTAITDRLISLLSSPHKLRELTLRTFVLTDNIIKSPYEMKNLKLINFSRVRMSLTTWQKFVDSLPVIPQAVTVEVWNMCVTRDGEECNPDKAWRWITGREEAAAFKYVKEREQLFRVDYEADTSIWFSTLK